MAKKRKRAAKRSAGKKAAPAGKAAGQNLYLLAIVSIVAVVGVVVLVLNAGGSDMALSDSDLTGEAYALGLKAGIAEASLNMETVEVNGQLVAFGGSETLNADGCNSKSICEDGSTEPCTKMSDGSCYCAPC